MIQIEPLEFIASLIEFNGVIVETSKDDLTYETVYSLFDNTKYVIQRKTKNSNIVGVYRAD